MTELRTSEPASAQEVVSCSPAPVLALEAVTKRWRQSPAPVLDAVTLRLAAGTATWLGGANGVGKTTLLRIAAGLIAADRGEVRLDCLHPERHRREYARRCGLLSAGDRGLYARFDARQHLDYWARLCLLPRDERRVAVERSLDAFGLAEFARRRVDRLSLGQRQRLRLAITFLHRPRLVLLDEPLTSLDDDGVARTTAAVQETVASGGAVLWVSPPADREAARFHRRLWLRAGHLEANGP